MLLLAVCSGLCSSDRVVGETPLADCLAKLRIGEQEQNEAKGVSEANAREKIGQLMIQKSENALELSDLRVEIRSYHFGSKDKNPLECLRFFKKEEKDGARKLPNYESCIIPVEFHTKRARVFCTCREEEKLEAAKRAWRAILCLEDDDDTMPLSQDH